MPRTWWPISPSRPERVAVEELRKRLRRKVLRLDRPLAVATGNLLTNLLARNADEIIGRDGLTHLGHVINGWGNVRHEGATIVSRLERFIHRDYKGAAHLLQVNPEGDVHPWQTFAYAVMAGIPSSTRVGPATLRQLTLGSDDLKTDCAAELGHFLFAIAFLGPQHSNRRFLFGGQPCSLPELVAAAIDAHLYGPFDVCRKFHLTEGLCAVAARLDSRTSLRRAAESFLHGQLEMLLLFGVAIERLERREVDEQSIVRRIRDRLALSRYLENHFYYAGHAIELACFAQLLGFELLPEHRAVIPFILDRLNRTLPRYAERLYFPACFLHFGHYRRALTLWTELEQRPHAQFAPRLLSRYTALLSDASQTYVPARLDETPVANDYELAPWAEGPRGRFRSILEEYRRVARPGFETYGGYSHFRRVLPAAWPRSVHYEFIDYGNQVGVELHIESDSALLLRDVIHDAAAQVTVPRAGPAQWDADWARGRGRLRVCFADRTSPQDVALGMIALLDQTFRTIDPIARTLRMPATRT